ncbi:MULTISPECIES: hypothetical protein [Thalassospira]|uniref:hypothetical protein n=1 Tax=Thalassospira TaxID=168934 RepID=UPI000A68AFED|nr:MULTISPECIES: hypothetical protein [Thalassospira]MBL4841033.1 hypothetical protein [Thalassospira sp.]MBR9780100.1 hypothetical protein [Rhodospirillales bacterium]MBR9817690.1 hypothetical protein [Rhodospirillales bacterium]MCD1594115.1 hypothetical protein [Thalassospira xiamenensis]QPL36487.1 hypothetical protein IT971_03965 [Thalassospira sp. B30-1]
MAIDGVCDDTLSGNRASAIITIAGFGTGIMAGLRAGLEKVSLMVALMVSGADHVGRFLL